MAKCWGRAEDKGGALRQSSRAEAEYIIGRQERGGVKGFDGLRQLPLTATIATTTSTTITTSITTSITTTTIMTTTTTTIGLHSLVGCVV